MLYLAILTLLLEAEVVDTSLRNPTQDIPITNPSDKKPGDKTHLNLAALAKSRNSQLSSCNLSSFTI